jgi:hypothetical protein
MSKNPGHIEVYKSLLLMPPPNNPILHGGEFFLAGNVSAGSWSGRVIGELSFFDRTQNPPAWRVLGNDVAFTYTENGQQKTRPQGKKWYNSLWFLFFQIPNAAQLPMGQLTFRVKISDSNDTDGSPAPEYIQFSGTANQGLAILGDMPVSTPLADSHVCTTFPVAGSGAAANVLVTVQITNSSSTSFEQQTTSNASGNWAVEFSNMAADTYSLNVWDAQGNTGGPNDGIVVSQSYCHGHSGGG